MVDSNQPVVALEVAEQEFVRFTEAMDLDVDPRGMDDDDKATFVQARRRFIGAVMNGSLVVNDAGEPVFTPTQGEPRNAITFHEPTGASLIATDVKKEGHNTAKTVAFLADITHVEAKTFAQMANRDFRVCTSISALFLGG